jgi:hypothetical protein
MVRDVKRALTFAASLVIGAVTSASGHISLGPAIVSVRTEPVTVSRVARDSTTSFHQPTFLLNATARVAGTIPTVHGHVGGYVRKGHGRKWSKLTISGAVTAERDRRATSCEP